MMRVSLLFVLFAGFTLTAQAGTRSEPSDESRFVSAFAIEQAPEDVWSITGTVQSRYVIPLSFRVGGKVEKRRVEVGQKIGQNQVLATLDQSDLKLALEQSKANLAKAKADTLNAERERERLTKLYTRKLVSEQDLQRAETAEISAKESVLSAKASLDLAQRQLDYSTLKSPDEGVLTSINVEEGQVVNAGQTLMQLATGMPEAVIQLPSSREQSPVQNAVAFGVEQNARCLATLRAKTPINNPATLQYQAYYTLKDCTRELPLGAVIRLQFTHQDTDLKRIPISALVNLGSQSSVWQIVNGKVHAVAVKVVRLGNRYAYIESDLALGTEIVAQGVHLLTENEQVMIQP